jgi:hypothetical protein
MANPPKLPKPTHGQLIPALRTLGSGKKRLSLTDKAQRELRRTGHNFDSACDLVGDCRHADIVKSEPDRDVEGRWVVVLRLSDENDAELYVKLSLPLPGLDSGRFISFKPWGLS